MANWNDEIKLIAKTTGGLNENGFELPSEETGRNVFANKKSVGHTEFYESLQSGEKAELKFDVHSDEYAGEDTVEYEGKRFHVSHTFQPKGSTDIELTLSDLPERNRDG